MKCIINALSRVISNILKGMCRGGGTGLADPVAAGPIIQSETNE